jgi:hypothetical protein
MTEYLKDSLLNQIFPTTAIDLNGGKEISIPSISSFNEVKMYVNKLNSIIVIVKSSLETLILIKDTLEILLDELNTTFASKDEFLTLIKSFPEKLAPFLTIKDGERELYLSGVLPKEVSEFRDLLIFLMEFPNKILYSDEENYLTFISIVKEEVKKVSERNRIIISGILDELYESYELIKKTQSISLSLINPDIVSSPMNKNSSIFLRKL